MCLEKKSVKMFFTHCNSVLIPRSHDPHALRVGRPQYESMSIVGESIVVRYSNGFGVI